MKRDVQEEHAAMADPGGVEPRVDSYAVLHGEGAGGGVVARKERYADLVNTYYDLATDFYEFGWGQSFHFAQQNSGESLRASLIRHEHFLADELALVLATGWSRPVSPQFAAHASEARVDEPYDPYARALTVRTPAHHRSEYLSEPRRGCDGGSGRSRHFYPHVLCAGPYVRARSRKEH